MTALRIKRGGSGEVTEAADDVEPGDAPWSKTEMLLADLIDAVRENTWAVFQSQSKEQVSRPDPLPRPGVSKPKPQYREADPLLVEWLTRRQNGEDTADLDSMFQNVTPLRPLTKPPGGDDGNRGRSQP